MDCICEGKRSGQWHYRLGIPPCEASIAARKAREQRLREAKKAAGISLKRKRAYKYRPRVRWIPGSDIVIPEFDPL